MTVEKKDASFITRHYGSIGGTKSALTQRRKGKDEIGPGVGTVSLIKLRKFGFKNLSPANVEID